MNNWLIVWFAQVFTNPFPKVEANNASRDNILNIVFGITGAIAVLIISLAGFRYVRSQGDPQTTAQAKNTIIYAAVGLLVTLTAYAIVGFVLQRVA